MRQSRFDSKTMIQGVIAIILLLSKLIFKIEIPNEIADTAFELVMGVYTAYAVGNNPSLKNEY